MEVDVDWENEKKMDMKYVEGYFGEWNAETWIGDCRGRCIKREGVVSRRFENQMNMGWGWERLVDSKNELMCLKLLDKVVGD